MRSVKCFAPPTLIRRIAAFQCLVLCFISCHRRVSTTSEDARPFQGGASAPSSASTPGKSRAETPTKAPEKSGFRLALVGDQGIGQRARAVLDLVREEAADALVVVGDFDYQNRPQQWAEMLEGLGREFPWFAVVGNHDIPRWSEYEAIISAKQRSIPGAECHGKPGRQSSCLFRGVQLIMSEIGTMGDPRENEAFIRRELESSHANWKLCLWHKNQHDMQTGAKGDEVGWGAYQACQAGGAIIASGHEHAYNRSRTLTRVGDRAAAHGAVGPFDELEVGSGKTFVAVTGLGGIQTRPFVKSHAEDTWWGAYLTADRESVKGQSRLANNANVVGALFIDFGDGGDPTRGRGRFITTSRRTFDDFVIHFVP